MPPPSANWFVVAPLPTQRCAQPLGVPARLVILERRIVPVVLERGGERVDDVREVVHGRGHALALMMANLSDGKVQPSKKTTSFL